MWRAEDMCRDNDSCKYFELVWSFDHVGMDIQGPQPNLIQDDPFMVVETNRYKNLDRAIPTIYTTVTTIAHIFSIHRVSKYGITSNVSIENSPQLSWKRFAVVCSILEGSNITTTENYPKQMVKRNKSTNE